MDRRKTCGKHVLFALAALMSLALTAQAQPYPRVFARRPQSQISLPTARAAASVRAAAAATVYLPLVISTPVVAPLQFSTQVDGGGAMEPRTDFPYGIKDLFVTARVSGGSGLVWRTAWTIDGTPAPNIGTSGTLASGSELAIDGICFGPIGPGGQVQCGDPIPRGSYQVDFYLGDLLYQTGTAVIQ